MSCFLNCYLCFNRSFAICLFATLVRYRPEPMLFSYVSIAHSRYAFSQPWAFQVPAINLASVSIAHSRYAFSQLHQLLARMTVVGRFTRSFPMCLFAT